MSELKKIISGGQTGVDQAALQAAIDSGLDHGGWCPPGRICETGKIPSHFKLKETLEERDQLAIDIPRSQRTIWNARDSDGSLIIVSELNIDSGTALTIDYCEQRNKPFLIVYLGKTSIIDINNWLEQHEIEILNVAGTSEKSSPGISSLTYQIISDIIS